nr:unnamed protein product [Callosobruchus analis]
MSHFVLNRQADQSINKLDTRKVYNSKSKSCTRCGSSKHYSDDRQLPRKREAMTFSNLIPDVENNADVQESHAIADTEISNATDNEEESRVGTTENTPQEDTQVDKK